jgi:hypothetical protein
MRPVLPAETVQRTMPIVVADDELASRGRILLSAESVDDD